MLCQAPTIEEGEMLQSYMTRWFRRSGYVKRTTFMKAATGTDCSLVTNAAYGKFDIRTRFFDIASKEQVLTNHTTYPYFCSHIEKKWHLTGSRENEGVIQRSKSIRTMLSWSGPLRFCPDCADEQITKSGIAIWLRTHNLPFVEGCSKHGVLLQHETDLSAHAHLDSGSGFGCLCLPSSTHESKVAADSVQIEFAQRSEEIMRIGQMEFLAGSEFKRFWATYLQTLAPSTTKSKLLAVAPNILFSAVQGTNDVPQLVKRHFDISYLCEQVQIFLGTSKAVTDPLFTLVFSRIYFPGMSVGDFLLHCRYVADDVYRPPLIQIQSSGTLAVATSDYK